MHEHSTTSAMPYCQVAGYNSSCKTITIFSSTKLAENRKCKNNCTSLSHCRAIKLTVYTPILQTWSQRIYSYIATLYMSMACDKLETSYSISGNAHADTCALPDICTHKPARLNRAEYEHNLYVSSIGQCTSVCVKLWLAMAAIEQLVSNTWKLMYVYSLAGSPLRAGS